MKQLLALIKSKGKSKKEISDEVKKSLKRKGAITENGFLKLKPTDHKDETRK